MMLVQSDAEIAYCKMLDVWEGSDVEHIPKITDKVCILDARRYDWFTPAAHKVACSAVYRKSCVKDIRFSDDLYIGEDTASKKHLRLFVRKVNYTITTAMISR